MSRRTSDEPNLVKDLQAQLKKLTADLRQRSDDPNDAWAQELKAEYEQARARGRTGFTWSEWRDGEIDLAAVAWIIATVFVRFSEDNNLIDGPWIAGTGPRYRQALDNETAFYQNDPNRNTRDWLRAGFTALANLPAGRDLLNPRHNLIWRAPISADSSDALLAFWRTQDTDGNLVHDLHDPDLDTRFLGDLYQDLSEHAKKKYALLQTPIFVEEFIIDRTLTPAINEFGLTDLKIIDPTCGSGHFLLGAFDRLLRQWQIEAPALETRQRVQKALDAIHGVDLNPFAVAIARFRLTVAALKASGLTSLKDAPAFNYHLAVGDSLLYGHSGIQEDLLASDDEEDFTYSNEDIAQEPHILDRGRYHVVVGNPPYITVKDKALNEAYRKAYSTCHRKYALSVPFMELFFELAIKANGTPAGYVGQITSNSFMKREFGSKVIQDLLSGTGSLSLSNPVDLQYVIDTSGAYIPGHGTPTVILIGRRQRPVGNTLRAVLGVRGEPGQPKNAAEGLVWTEIVHNLNSEHYDGTYVTVTDLQRDVLAEHPWSLSGGGAGDLRLALEAKSESLSECVDSTGFAAITGEDEFFVRKDSIKRLARNSVRVRSFVAGENVRDYQVSGAGAAVFPYPIEDAEESMRIFWPFRTNLRSGLAFQQTREQRGMWWGEYILPNWPRLNAEMLITFAFVATHNHFVLDRGGKVFKQSAPVIKLPEGASEDEYLDLLGVLNSSTACFWLKQVCHDKGNGGYGGGIADQEWERFFEFTGTKLEEFPLPPVFPRERARELDALAAEAGSFLPSAALATGVSREKLRAAGESWASARARLVFEQEEMDWQVYRAYGLIDEDLTYSGAGLDQLLLGERAFEIALARRVAEGTEETAWFERHGSTPITDLPLSWPADYRELVQRRLALIESDPFLGMLERPEYKRRWQSATFDDLVPDALRGFVLDRLEDASLWADGSGPRVLSVAQVADRVRGDADLVEAVRLLVGAVEVDLTQELSRLIADEAVPFLAAHRYKDSGLRKRAEWESVWEMQRREDAGETVSIPVPPKYSSGDFRKTAYWKARGKLDVPKERFVSYPLAQRPGDRSMVIGWAGWHHLEQARALARLLMERTGDEGLDAQVQVSLLAGLVELEPWLKQWHNDPDPEFGGVSPAVYFTGFIDSQLSMLGKTREDARAWRP